MAWYSSEYSLIEVKGNPFEDFYEEVVGLCHDEEIKAPTILIECDEDLTDKISSEFSSALHQFVEEENQKLDLLYEEWEEDGEYIERDYYSEYVVEKLAPCEKGLYAYTWFSSSLNNDEMEMDMDRLIDPLEFVFDAIRKKYPQIKIDVCLPYHANIGYNYGYDAVWTEGDCRPLAGKQLYECLKNTEFWEYYVSGSDSYQKLFSLVLGYSDVMEEDWLSVFWAHVPEIDAELRFRLLEMKKNHEGI